MSRAQAVRSIRATEVIASKAMQHAEEWEEVDECFREGFTNLADQARKLAAELEEMHPGRPKPKSGPNGGRRSIEDDQQELPL